MAEKLSESVVGKPTKRITLEFYNGQWKANYDPTCEQMLTRRDVTVLLPRVLIVKQRQLAREHYLKTVNNTKPTVGKA